MDGSKKRRSFLCVPGSNAPPLFEMKESVFDQMPKLVEVLVVLALVFAIFLWRNNDFHLFLPGLVNNRVGIIGAISQEILGIDALYET